MKFNRLSIVLTILMVLTMALTSCNDGKKEAEELRLEADRIEMEAAKEAEAAEMAIKAKADEARANSIAGMAMKNNDLTTLLSSLKAADLATMLSEPGNYTVFAPSNQAFEKLSQAQRDELMKPENKEQLKDVLQYHVVVGKITSNQLANAIKNNSSGYKVKTVKGDELTFTMKGDQYVIKDSSGKKAQVILGNQEASNGIVYIIDTVLMSKK